MMKKPSKFLLTTIFVLLLAIPFQKHVAAKELRYAIAIAPGSDVMQVVERYVSSIDHFSDGALTARIYGLGLLSFSEKSDGIRDGIADIGFVLQPYHPSQYPLVNFVGETSMLVERFEGEHRGKEGMAFGGALMDFVMHHCPECQDEILSQNQVATALSAGNWYGLMCTRPIRTISDLRGKRIRVGASNFARWASHVGASPITMSINDAYDRFSRGLIDCIALAPPDIPTYRLDDLITDITMDVPGGTFPYSPAQVNLETWRGLNDEQRLALLKAGANLAAGIVWHFYEETDVVLDMMENEVGATFHEVDDAVVEATRDFIGSDMHTIIREYESRHGIEGGYEKLKVFRDLIAKWSELVKDVSSEEELFELYWDEILSKLDVQTYGMR